MDFFGASDGSLFRFWTKCAEIWTVALEPHPTFAGEMKRYFGMLTQSSLEGKRSNVPAVSGGPSAPIAIESPKKTEKVHVSAPTGNEGVPEMHPLTSAPAAIETPNKPEEMYVPAPAGIESVPEMPPLRPTPAAAKPPNQPEKAYVPAPAGNESVPEIPPLPSAPAAAEPPDKPEDMYVPAPAGNESVPETPPLPPTSAAAGLPDKPEQKQASASSGNENVPATPVLPPVPKVGPEPQVLPKNAYLVLQGTRVIPLNQPFIKIGRQLDNHVILEDPRVSRSHAQIKLINERFVIFDMNSTGGTFVNGKQTSQSVLYPGDVISLAGVIFIYSQEVPAKPGDVKIIELGSPFAADRPTAIMHKEEIKLPKKTDKKDMPDLPQTGPLGR